MPGLIGQLFVWANGVPTFMLVSVIALESVFFNVTNCGALMLPTATFVKLRDVGENRIGPIMPRPVKGTDCDRPGASSRIVTPLVLLPDASGRNWSETVQEAAAAKVAGKSGQVVEFATKSEPSGTEMLEIVSGIDWLLVKVKDFGAEVCPI